MDRAVKTCCGEKAIYLDQPPGTGRSKESMDHFIPCIDVSSLFETPSRTRELTDQAIMAAAASPGFMVVRGFPPDVPASRAARADLLRLFDLPESETRKLWRQ